MEETIKGLCHDKSVANYLCSIPLRYEGTALKDITDATIIRKNTFFKEYPAALIIIEYPDSFELACPIGPAEKIYKMMDVYGSF